MSEVGLNKDKRIYLVGAPHVTRDHATKIIGVLKEISRDNKVFHIGEESWNTHSLRTIFASLNRLSPSKIEEFVKLCSPFPDCFLPLFQEYGNLKRSGIVKEIVPVDQYLDNELDPNGTINDGLRTKLTDYARKFNENKSKMRKSRRFCDKLPLAIKYSAALSESNFLRESVMIDNSKRHIPLLDESFVIRIGSVHLPSLEAGLNDFNPMVRRIKGSLSEELGTDIMIECDSILKNGGVLGDISVTAAKSLLYDYLSVVLEYPRISEEQRSDLENKWVPRIASVTALKEAEKLHEVFSKIKIRVQEEE